MIEEQTPADMPAFATLAVENTPADPQVNFQRREVTGSILGSLIFHLLIVLVLVFGLPFLRRTPIGEATNRPITITMVDEPNDADAPPQAAISSGAVSPAVMAAAASNQPAVSQPAIPQPAETPPQATAAPSTASAVQPPDPSFDPFAQRTDQTEETADNPPAASSSSAATPQRRAPPLPAQQIDDAAVGPNLTEGDIGRMSAMSQSHGAPGEPSDAANRAGNGGTSTVHPQYLQIRLNGYVSAGFSAQLQRFLIRLIACGVHPITVTNPNLAVEADVTFAANGAIQVARLTNENAFPDDPVYPRAAERLMTALTNPACTYMELPPFAYSSWRSAHVSFYQRN